MRVEEEMQHAIRHTLTRPSRLRTVVFSAGLLLSGLLSAGAELVWESRSLERDAAPSDRVVVLAFPFRNAGDAEVAIKAVRTRSAVVEVEASAESVPPGGEAEIEARVPVDGSVRERSGTIRVFTDDADGGVVDLRYVVRVPEWLRLSERLLRWSPGGPEAAVEPQSVAVTVPDDSGVVVEGVRIEPGGFVATLERGDEEGEYRVRVRPESIERPARARVRLLTRPAMADVRASSFMVAVAEAPRRAAANDEPSEERNSAGGAPSEVHRDGGAPE